VREVNMLRQLRFSFVMAALLVGVLATVLPGLAEEPSGEKVTGASAQPPSFVVYYFHGNMRCATCRKLEAYSEEAITQGFAKDLESGALAWRVVNTDEPENKHFVKDFQLVTKSLVLVEYHDGEVTRFENLKEIWQKVGDKDGFLEYVRDSTREFVGKS
jgi:hypothetical protein